MKMMKCLKKKREERREIILALAGWFHERENGEFEKFDCFRMFYRSERFRENVSRLFGGRDMLKVNLSGCIDLTNIVKTSVNVFCASMLDIVFDMF